jgi:hypothetical protein
VSEIVTVCVEVYVPAVGENVGVATVSVYVADPTFEFVEPDLTPMALMV